MLLDSPANLKVRNLCEESAAFKLKENYTNLSAKTQLYLQVLMYVCLLFSLNAVLWQEVYSACLSRM